MNNIWRIVHRERAALIQDLAVLPPWDWQPPSLRPGLTLNDVLAHLVDYATTTKTSFILNMNRARFNIDRVKQRGSARTRQDNPGATLALFAMA